MCTYGFLNRASPITAIADALAMRADLSGKYPESAATWDADCIRDVQRIVDAVHAEAMAVAAMDPAFAKATAPVLARAA